MDRVVNLPLLANPWNWLTVGGMILLTWLAILVIHSHAGSSPTDPSNIQKGS